MNNKQKIILIFIIAIIAIICFLIYSILEINNSSIKDVEVNYIKNNSSNNLIINNEEQHNEVLLEVLESERPDESNLVIKYEFELANNSTRFYTVNNCIENYIDNIKEKKYSNILDLLDSTYKENNNIDESNIVKYINNVSYNDLLIVDKIYEKLGDVFQQYVAHGYLVNKNDNTISDIYFFIVFDTSNFTYSIIPQFNVSSEQQVKLKEKINTIETNESNKYEYYRISQQEESSKLYNFYNQLLLYVPQRAYQYLDQEYKKIRFNNNYQEFINYINNNKSKISNSVVTGYSVDNKQYIMTNNINNTYIFDVNHVMDFKVKLDNYTIKQKDFNNYNEEIKVNFYTEQIINMINYKDYRNLYLLINDTFKNNNFNSIEKFKEVINENFYNTNYIIENDIELKDEYYVAKIKIADNISNTSNKKNVNFILKVLDNNFEMSFSFEQ